MEQEKQKFRPRDSVIQICKTCGRIDVTVGHEKECDSGLEEERRINQDYYD